MIKRLETKQIGEGFDMEKRRLDSIDLVEDFNKEARKMKSIVYLEITFSDSPTFQFRYDVLSDKFIEGKYYKKGEAIVYISDHAYKLVDIIAKRIGYSGVDWNNTRSIGWLIF